MKAILSLSVCVNLILASTTIYLTVTTDSEREGYIVNQEVFDAFEGKKLLNDRLEQVKQQQTSYLDSIRNGLNQSNEKEMLFYQERVQLFQATYQQLAQQYTAEIWQNINQYLKEFGEEYQYQFIYGATGDGNLMYGRQAENISEDVIRYINSKYQGDE